MKKINIVFFIYYLGSGGAARTFLNLINNIDRNRFNPILVTCNYEGNYEHDLKEDIKFIKLPTKRLRSAIIPLAKVIKSEKADIVFSTIPNYNTIAILANLLSFTKAKNIVREAALLGGTFTSNMKLILYGLLYIFASSVIALSKGVKDNIIKRYKVNKNKIQVIYNPVDIDTIQTSMQEEMNKDHLPYFNMGEKTIVTAGRLVPDKDHKTLLKALSILTKKVDSHLVILGEGELEEELKNYAIELNISERVHFIGFQKNPYVYFRHADVFVLSSKREGFGHVLTEALATKTPVVSTNCKPGAVEVLENGKYGKLCEVGDPESMAEVIYSTLMLTDTERNHVINEGLKRVEEFNVKLIVKQYEGVFSQYSTVRQSELG